MHYHLEIIMPPTSDVAAAVKKIMAPFCEHSRDEDSLPPFWDWYVIGGRWAGEKLRVRLGKDKLEAFWAAIKAANVTVSGLQAGKPTLSPASQIPAVDALWREHFPGTTEACPLFDHCGESVVGDICALSELPDGLTASRVIVAGPDYQDVISAQFMAQESFWNGVDHVETKWDGTVHGALVDYAEKLSAYQQEYAEKNTPKPDWLLVTVDYHS